MTILDLFIGAPTILVFLALVESVTTTYLFFQDRLAIARRIDRTSRVAFPAAFVVVSVVIFYR